LQRDPMQTNRETKSTDRGDSADPAQHDCEANHRLVSCQLSPARLQRRFVATGSQPMGYRLVACATQIACILVEIRLLGLECADMSALSKR
jgi:hypothetical protein